jgi:ACS family pantothenate transporter-like MFS transporter
LFIIDFLITFPIALLGFLVFPDTPESSRARWLTPEEKTLAIERLPEVTKVRGVLGWSVISRVLGTWHFWAFVMVWTFASNTEMFSTNAIMNLWLSGTGDYTVEQVNYIPTGVAAVGVLATLFMGWYCDFTKRHWHTGIILSFTAILSGAIMLNSREIPRGAKFFALFLNGCQYASQTALFAWANALTRDDDAKRAVVLAAMNTVAIAVYMFWSLVFYNAAQAPHWRKGSIAMLCMGVAFFFNTLVVRYLQQRQKKREACEGIAPATEKSEDGAELDVHKAGDTVKEQQV